jgi:subtilisin family serine protease
MNEVVSVGNIAHRLKIITMSNKYASQGGVATPTDLTPFESTKGEGYLAKSSSVGPVLIDNRVKPDVCAPGVNIVSAQNFFIDDDTYYALAGWDIGAMDTEYESWGNGVAGYFHIMAQTGTSMSAPAVTGTIALWLQADPTLTVERIKEGIAHSSRQPDATLTYPNQQYGYGEIDVYRGLLYILGLDRVETISQQHTAARIAVSGGELVITLPEPLAVSARLRLFTVGGRLQRDVRLPAGQSVYRLSLTTLPSGLYALQLDGPSVIKGSTLIRK